MQSRNLYRIYVNKHCKQSLRRCVYVFALDIIYSTYHSLFQQLAYQKAELTCPRTRLYSALALTIDSNAEFIVEYVFGILYCTKPKNASNAWLGRHTGPSFKTLQETWRYGTEQGYAISVKYQGLFVHLVIPIGNHGNQKDT